MKKQYVIAIVALVIFSVSLFLLTNFKKASILAVDGYFVTDNNIDEVLLSDKKDVKSKNFKLSKVSYEDTFYANISGLYVGEEKKTHVNQTYPIFSNDGNAVVNLDSKSKIINNKFEFFDCYENATLTGEKLYNYNDLEQADYETYLFLQLSNMSYVNLTEVKIKTLSHEYTIPVNSIINFQEEYLKYYYYDKTGKLVYNVIDGIDLDSTINMGDDKFSYKHLLIKIDKIDEDETEVDIGTTGEETNNPNSSNSNNSSNNNSTNGTTEKKYVKPKVSVDDFSANVYSATSNLHISDPSGVVVGGINFQFKIGEKIFLRKTFISSGKLQISGLVPNTGFTIVGSYKYYNEENKKMEVNFFEQNVTTLGMDKLDPIELEFNNGPIFSNKLQVDNLKIVSDLKSEAIKGINKAVIHINDDIYSLSSNVVQDLINGKEKSYSSPAKLASNEALKYEFQLLDAFGNQIKLKSKTGNSRTSKASPSTIVQVTKSEVNSMSFSVKLKNDDKVNINSYRYLIYNKDMAIVAEGDLDNSKELQDVTLKSLDPNTTYVIKIVGNYNLEDGNGNVIDGVIGEGKFTTLPLSSLGYVRVNSDIISLTNNSAEITTNIDVASVSPILLELLDSLKIRVTNSKGESVYSKTYSGIELEGIKAGQNFIDTVSTLDSTAEYNIEFTSYVLQGSVKEQISVLSSLKKFKTLKKDAYINIINKFVNGNMIDFDVKAVDNDGAIESNRVLLEVRDSSEKLIAMESIDVNGDYKRLTYEKLNANEKYTFTYKIEEYNVGYDNSTYESDYVLFKETIVTEEGIKGSIDMVSMLRQIDSQNLFNIEDYSRIRKEGYTSYKEYDLKNNTVMFGAKNGYVNFSYFLPEAYHSSVTVSFYAKYTDDSPNTADIYIGQGSYQNLNYRVDNLKKGEWKKYTYSFTMTGNYIGFVINDTANVNKRTNVLFKDIQILSTDMSVPALNDVTYSYHKSGYKFSDAVMYGGNETMPSNKAGENTTIGNYGDGYAKITNLKSKEVTVFNYTGSSQKFDILDSGKYKFELWGAAGGDGSGTYGLNQTASSHAGRGSYTSGIVSLTKDTSLYIYVGGKGIYGRGLSSYGGPVGGFNGGGNGGNYISASGGGATDVRITDGSWNDSESLKSRIMVAAGGGGADDYGGDNGTGGPGGSLKSIGTYVNGSLNTNYYATQTGGYKFGIGGNVTTNTDSGGAGGGYYGGVVSNSSAGGGSGGSSYISGYKGCIAYDKVYSAPENYIKYSEKDEYLGTLNISLYDTKDEITTNDYYVRIYLKGELQKTIKYDLIDNKVENIEKQFEFIKNNNYTVKLSVKIRDRFYDIDSLDFNTNTEIRSIRTVSEFFAMHPNGKYIVLNDLDFTNNGSVYSPLFYGEIDFQGHAITWNCLNRNSYLFHTIYSSARVKNLVINVNLDNTSARGWFYGLSYRNFGIIDNLIINLLSSTSQPNDVFDLVSYVNYGTIQNFVVNCEVSLFTKSRTGLLTWSNEGTIRNGYIYGENIKAYYESPDVRKDVGVITGTATTNSRIENVFSLISVEKDSTLASEVSVGNLIGNSSTGTLQNVYSSEDPDKTNTNLLNRDPNIGNVGGINAKNVFYSSDKIYSGKYSTKISKLALYDADFQNKVLNTHDGFNVDTFVSLGYYPQVKMNDCMPNQEWIALPKVTDTDLVDITSSEEVSSDGDSATVILNINNPGAEKITSIGIQDINVVKIISQENEWGKTKLKIEISSPTKYQSKYYVRYMKIDRGMGIEYEKTYGQYERGIDVDLYYPINSLNDWKLINQTPNQNYILQTDLDFKGTTISSYLVNNTFSGKLNGNGHTIKNISISSNNGMFNNFTGTIKNLFVENYNKSNFTSYGGFIYQGNSNAVIDNVHMNNITISAVSFVGGIIGYGNNITIKNSSVTGYKNATRADSEDIYIGALAGYLNNTLIQNSYTQDVDINITDSISTYGIGGVVGRIASGTIENVYATGSIKSNSNYVGGVVGYGNAKISNVWSNVDISSQLDFVGGIIGRRDTSNISDTLVVGPVLSTYEGLNIHRTSGNTLVTPQNNYAWENQKYFGFVTGDASAEVLLTDEQLMDYNTYYDLLNFGDQFDYTDISKGSLPKLKNYDTGELLPKQNDSIPEKEKFDITNMQIDASVSNATLHFEIVNPEEINITGVEFDYLDVSKTKIVTRDGISIVDLQVTPNRYYDNYVLTGIKYSTGSGPDKTYTKSVRIETQFYKTISKYEDWQQISKKTTENYRLVADIDFSGKININYNVSIGRLEGQDNGYTLKNFTLASPTVNVALIRKITTTLKNVTFDNFNISTTASGDYVNIIKYNYADVENVHFNNNTITASKSSYVGPIAWHRGIDMRDVSVYNNNIRGVSFVGGLVARSLNYDTYNISANHCTVYGASQYVGGIFGYKEYSNPATNFNYTAVDMNVTGKTDAGGIFGYGGANSSSISDSTVTGIAGGNYIGGLAGRNGQYYANTLTVRNCTILAHGNNHVGGMFGWSYDLIDAYVYDTTVTQEGASYSYTGGLTGQKGYTYQRVGVTGSTVTSAGTGTGGLFGYMDGPVYYSYVYDTDVNGVNRVGGLSGYVISGRTYYNITNAKVTGTGSYVGGIFGYINNVDDTNTSYSTIGHNVILANAEITGKNYVGGYTGYSPKQLTNAMFYHTILVGNITSTMTGASVGPITGLDKNFTTSVPRFYVYEKNQINGEYIKNIDGYVSVDAANYTTATDLKTQSYYTGRSFTTGYWEYAGLTNGYYPKVKNNSGTQKDLKLPVDAVSYSLRSRISLVDHELPKLSAYSSGINTVNIEFDKIDQYSYFEVYENNKKIIDQDINQRTYTINYNYKSDLKIVLSDGVNKKVKLYNASDLINKVTTFDNKYAYIYDGTLKGNITSSKDKFIHIFGDKALTEDLKIYDLSQGKYISSNNTFDVDLLGEVNSLYEFEIGDNLIDTYGSYSIIHSASGDTIYDKQLFVKNDAMEIVDSELDNKKDSIIIDEYAKNNYVTILGNDGAIYNLKTEIDVPSGFSNKNISYMSNNLNSKSSVIIIMYKTGKVIVFDYRTGKLVKEEKATDDVSIVDYFKENLAYRKSLISDNTKSSYQDSLDLKELLEKSPISEDESGNYVNDNDNSSKNDTVIINNMPNYVTYYNAVTKKYDVINVVNIIEDGKDVVSENDKIYTSAPLVAYYMQESIFEQVFGNVNVLVIFGIILIGIVLAMILWYKNIKVLKVNEEKQNEK